MLPANDLKQISELVGPLWLDLKGQRIFVSGGTGFVGSWIIESFLAVNKEFSLGAEMVVLSRNPVHYLDLNPQFKSDPALSFVAGDVRNFSEPIGNFDFVIHAATEPVVSSSPEQQIHTMDVCYSGTKRILEFCKSKKVKKYLYVSSGAVYGRQPENLSQLPEEFVGIQNPQDVSFAYGEGKRVGEWLSLQYGKAFDFEVKIARCFAFVGPHLPLNGHFAIGNFIADALVGKDISVRGNGLAIRSYMYASDLTVWLWKILFRGNNLNAYNVGSDQALSMKELANKICVVASPYLKVQVQGETVGNLSGDLYIPSIKKAQNELNLKLAVSVEEAIERTFQFYKSTKEA